MEVADSVRHILKENLILKAGRGRLEGISAPVLAQIREQKRLRRRWRWMFPSLFLSLLTQLVSPPGAGAGSTCGMVCGEHAVEGWRAVGRPTNAHYKTRCGRRKGGDKPNAKRDRKGLHCRDLKAVYRS